ncbi:MAG: PP2C family protein-serine/threonine phosphatase [Leptospirales bacterium]
MNSGEQTAAASADATLEQENHRLRALLASFALLNSSLELDTVLKNTLTTACDLMSASIASIALINNEGTELEFLESNDPNFDKLKSLSVPLGQGVAGTVAISGKTERIKDIHNDSRFYQEIDRALGQTTSSYLCTPLIVEDGIIGTLQIMNRRPELQQGATFTAEDEPLVEGFARQAALAIQNAKLHQLKLQQRAFDLEMQVCAEIQANLFPRRVPEVPGFELYGASVPAQQVGGDYYSFVKRPDGTCDVVLADVSGKGLPASLIVSDFHTGYQLLVQLEDPIEVSFNKLNAHLNETLVTGKFITVFAVRITPGLDRLEYVVAGHPPPYVIRENGEIEELRRTGPVLGLLDVPFTKGEIEMYPGDILLAFSDGFSEVHDIQEELYGEDRMAKFVQEFRTESLGSIHERLKQDVDRFRDEVPLPDDMSINLIRRLPA